MPPPVAGANATGVSEVSPATQELIDREVRRIVDAAHADVTALLTENRAKLDSLTAALLEAETLDEAEAYVAAGVRRDGRNGRGDVEPPSIAAAQVTDS